MTLLSGYTITYFLRFVNISGDEVTSPMYNVVDREASHPT